MESTTVKPTHPDGGLATNLVTSTNKLPAFDSDLSMWTNQTSAHFRRPHSMHGGSYGQQTLPPLNAMGMSHVRGFAPNMYTQSPFDQSSANGSIGFNARNQQVMPNTQYMGGRLQQSFKVPPPNNYGLSDSSWINNSNIGQSMFVSNGGGPIVTQPPPAEFNPYNNVVGRPTGSFYPSQQAPPFFNGPTIMNPSTQAPPVFHSLRQSDVTQQQNNQHGWSGWN